MIGQLRHYTTITEIRFAFRGVLGLRPGLYFALQRLRPNRRHLVVRKDTEIVVEGYPRSANTFTVAAFLFAQGRPVKIARHLHVPANVIQAVKRGIPTLVLIRKPEDAVLSLLVREPTLAAKRALRDYVLFYSTIRPYRSGFLLVTFEEVTTDFGKVIDTLNARFGTRFLSFKNTPENMKKVFEVVEEMDKADRGKEQVTETTVARPSELKLKLKMQKQHELRRPEIVPLLHRANAIYKKWLVNCAHFDNPQPLPPARR